MKVCDQAPVSGGWNHPGSGPQAREVKPGSGCRKASPNYLDIVGLVRSVQRAEGHNDCFRRELCDCDQLDCPWREKCFKEFEAAAQTF